MKRIIFLFLLGAFLVGPTLRAQPDESGVVLAHHDKTTKATIRYILREILESRQVQLSYSEDKLNNLEKEIEMPAGDLTVDQLLELISEKGGLTYKKVGQNIILKPSKQETFTISGYIYDDLTGETLIGSTVQIEGTTIGVLANVYGFYSLSVPEGKHTLLYSSVGYGIHKEEVEATLDQVVNIRMKPYTKLLNEVIVTAEAEDENVTVNSMGHSQISATAISKIPALMGEVDVLRTLKLLPGVQMTSETSSGFSVRGGGHDQNLILLDEAVVYNPSHLFGFFSTFNNDAIKNVEFYKGNIPARYGGRLSSLVDIRMKEGNNQKFTGSGGISPIASRLTLEVPIVKDKGSIIVSGRRTYADIIARAVSKNARNATLFFYDFNMKANYTINDKNRVYVSGYAGKDTFGFKSDSFNPAFKWGNITNTIRWNHVFSSKLFSNTSLIYSKYDYNLSFGSRDFFFEWTSSLRDYTAKVDFDWFLNERNTVNFGVSSTYHFIRPGKVFLKSNQENGSVSIASNRSLDHAIYVSNQQVISDRFQIKYGARISAFQNIGDGVSYRFDDNFNRTDSIAYKNGEVFNTYVRVEPRLSTVFKLNATSSVKASYARTAQYLQLASNSIAGTPLDIWFPASPNVKPQLADQVSGGYFRNFFGNKIETSVEVFHKWLHSQIDFRDHAELLLNPELEGELRIGKAWAYGAELLIKKPQGRFNGWLSFTWSRSFRKVPSVSRGATYASNFDRPINLSLVGNYELSERLSLSGNWVYFHGLPFTAPTGKQVYGNVTIPTYTGRNGDRLPQYHRFDLSLSLDAKKNTTRKLKGTWVLSVYNLYGRKNAAFISFQQGSDGQVGTEARRLTIFRWVPTLAYNFKF